MQRWCLAAVWAVAFSCVVVPAAAAKQRPQDRLNAYTVVTSSKQLAAFEDKGLDVASSRVMARGVKAQMILTRSQVQDVRAEGASAKLTHVTTTFIQGAPEVLARRREQALACAPHRRLRARF